ncbi:DUF485 domain-containing protein [Streptomyces resistomycificus]|uniref:DUF485 domain-containing protein n=1 Tax=Streptomyces resistomycificus TaxID=67356 RepID=A0A0L8LWP1_9ACTN|nr:DUF485 domain-containing protein [Streptomyces resistomycificus]KOG42499.1 hypothetical protein ADK37_05115 [Streptomyces resistomycificus]KUN92650.1 hypothetical protein AQJ84_32220 [Streptomyces resistomycificus]
MSRHSTRLGGPPPSFETPPAPAERRSVSQDPAYRSLRRAHRRFGARATAAAVGGFLLYVLLSSFVPGLMNRTVGGHLTVGLALGLGQFVLMAVIVWRYLVHMRTRITPAARGLRGLVRQQEEAAARERAATAPRVAPRAAEFRPW